MRYKRYHRYGYRRRPPSAAKRLEREFERRDATRYSAPAYAPRKAPSTRYEKYSSDLHNRKARAIRSMESARRNPTYTKNSHAAYGAVVGRRVPRMRTQ